MFSFASIKKNLQLIQFKLLMLAESGNIQCYQIIFYSLIVIIEGSITLSKSSLLNLNKKKTYNRVVVLSLFCRWFPLFNTESFSFVVIYAASHLSTIFSMGLFLFGFFFWKYQAIFRSISN